jgi:putative flippase GtrA
MSNQFVRFCVTGGLGVLTDAGIYFILVRVFHARESYFLIKFIWIFGYIAAVIQNYLINHFWTFHDQTKEFNVSTKAFINFLSVSLISLIPRYLVYTMILSYGGEETALVPDLANLGGIIAGTVVNFIGSKYFVFKNRDDEIS